MTCLLHSIPIPQSGHEATYLTAWELGVVGFFIRRSGLTDALQWMVTNMRIKKKQTITLMKISRTDGMGLSDGKDISHLTYYTINLLLMCTVSVILVNKTVR